MTLMPDKRDFAIWRGATFKHRIEYLTGAKGSPAQNLTGHTAELIIRNQMGGAALYTMTTANAGIVILPLTGIIDLLIPAATTAGFTWQSGVYDLTITSPGSVTDALLWGKFVCKGI